MQLVFVFEGKIYNRYNHRISFLYNYINLYIYIFYIKFISIDYMIISIIYYYIYVKQGFYIIDIIDIIDFQSF